MTASAPTCPAWAACSVAVEMLVPAHADDDGDAFVGFFYNDFDESLPLSIREILKFTPKHGKDQATSTGGDAEVDLTLKALDIKVTGFGNGCL